MAEAEKYLIDRFYQEFWLFFILLAVTIICSAIMVVVFVIRFQKLDIKFRIIIPIVCVLLIALSFVLNIYFSKYFEDLIYLRSNEPIQIEGKVIGYAVAVSSDDLTVKRSWPIVSIDGTKEQISLGVSHAERKLNIDQEYTFLYLPHTRIAEVIKY